jgi:hypothetical protein
MTRRFISRLSCEQGQALIEGLLALSLLLLVVSFAGQTIAYVHARNVAEAAAQEGASDAATSGAQAGITRAHAILTAAGGTGSHLHASATTDGNEITITVEGTAPKLLSLPLLLPAVHVAASLPIEQYPADEQAAATP